MLTPDRSKICAEPKKASLNHTDDMLAMANVRPEGKPSGGVTRQGPGDLGYVNYGEKLRDKLVVAKVLCLVDGPSRGRRATRGF